MASVKNTKKDAGKVALSFGKVLNRKPVLCKVFGGEHWLHPVPMVEGMIVDAQVGELHDRLKDTIKSKTVLEGTLTKAMSIGTIQCALREGREPDSKLVFPDFETAYAHLANKVDILLEGYALYAQNFELTESEKKS